MKVGYVCTSTNNAALSRSAIASLHASGRGPDVRAVIVDNHSREEEVAALQATAREFPGVELVLNAENVGYFRGLNLGIRRSRDRFPDVEHLVVGNDDLTFAPDFIATLERHRDVFDTWAVVAPDLVTVDGVHQNPHVRQPIGPARKLVWDLYYSSYGMSTVIRAAARLSRRFTVRDENAPGSELYKVPGPIEQGYGACYILGPLFFRHFSQFCAPTFFGQEEYFLYEQLKTIGQMVYYDPRFAITHHTHATVGRWRNRSYWERARESHRTYKRYLALSPAERRAFFAECRAHAS